MNTVLRNKREEKNLTQPQVADMLGVSVRTYQNYEADIYRPDVIIGQLLAQVLDSSIEELFPIDHLLEQGDENLSNKE